MNLLIPSLICLTNFFHKTIPNQFPNSLPRQAILYNSISFQNPLQKS